MPRIIYGTADTTLREIVHLSIGGPEVRVVSPPELTGLAAEAAGRVLARYESDSVAS